MLEQFEEVVEDWYFHHQDQRLENFLCRDHVLDTSERGRGQPAARYSRTAETTAAFVCSSPLRVSDGGVEGRGGEQRRGWQRRHRGRGGEGS